jgi:hypothetical protein
MAINNLSYSDTFKKWFDTTNTVISTVNGITVYNIVAGDGIGVTSSSNVFTVSHGSNVSTGVTFSGNVNFTGVVSFTNSPISNATTVVSVSPKISGITSGNVVRIDSAGLTLAKADSAVNSEVLGIVVSETASANVVALSGLIDNTTFSGTIANALGVAGGTLSPGQAYFLNPSMAGGITSVEPSTYGQVSKPILLGITGNAGSLLTYRGILLEGISAGITAELDNKIIVEIDYATATISTGNAVKVGDPVCFYRDVEAAEASINTNNPSGSPKLKTYGKLNNSSYNCSFIPDLSVWTDATVLRGKEFLGLISKIISNASSKYLLEITLPGGSFTTTVSELDTNFYVDTAQTNYLNLNSLGKLVTATSNSKFINLVHLNDGFNTVKIIITGLNGVSSFTGEPTPPSYISSGLTAALEYYNLLPNGSFAVWQRPALLKSTTVASSYTTDYLVQPNSSTATDAGGAYTYYLKYIDPIADRWFAVRNLDYFTYTSGGNRFIGLTAGSNITRQAFASDQAEVPGSPLYYLDCKFDYSLTPVNNNRRPRLENIQANARLAQNQRVTVSFWGKSTVLGSTLDLIYNRYTPNYSSESGFTAALEGRTNVTIASGGITLGLAWQKYKRSFDMSVAPFTLADNELGWLGVGFEFPSSTATISLAQAQMHLGNEAAEPLNINYDDELKRCKKLYQTSFEQGVTYISKGLAANLKGSPNRENTEYPARLVFTSRNPIFNYPVSMDLTPSDVVYYSPFSGNHGIAYIINDDKSITKDTNQITTSDNQRLPWQNVNFAGSTITKSRLTNTASPDLYITSSTGIFKSYAIAGTGNGLLGPITYLDTVVFDYILDADITSSNYQTNSFSIQYPNKVYY